MKYLKTYETYDELSGELGKLHVMLRQFTRDVVQLKELENIFFVLAKDTEYYMTTRNQLGVLQISFQKDLPDSDVEKEFDEVRTLLERRRKFLEQEYGFKTQYRIRINNTDQSLYNKEELKWNTIQYQGYKPNGTGTAKINIEFFIV
jgi:hypothetical protein